MQITQAVLPCLTIGDKALRHSPRDTQAIVLRNLRSLTDRAEEGLVRLQALEEDRLRAAAALHGAHRPGKLLELLSLVQFVPVVSPRMRSEEHTAELQSLMSISYAVFCLKKKILPTETRSIRTI